MLNVSFMALVFTGGDMNLNSLKLRLSDLGGSPSSHIRLFMDISCSAKLAFLLDLNPLSISQPTQFEYLM